MTKFFLRILCVIGLSTSAGLILTNESINNDTDQYEYQELTPQQKELILEFHENLLHEVRTQTEQISFCLQQLTQTIVAGKLNNETTKQITAINEIQNIQKKITRQLLEKILIQAEPELIMYGFALNYCLIEYLLPMIQKNPLNIQHEALNKIIEKVIPQDDSELDKDKLDNIIRSNRANLPLLIKATDNVGLTWYNQAYRTLKKYNTYYVIKGTTLVVAAGAIAAFASAVAVNRLPEWLTDKEWFKNYIANTYISSTGGMKCQYVTNSEGTKTLEPLTNFPKVQNLVFAIEDFSKLGICAISPLLTINYKEILDNMYGSSWASFKAFSNKKQEQIDAVLQGTQSKLNQKADHEKVYFKDLVGVEHLEELAKKIANFIKHPERYERTNIEEHRGILLYGPPQTGKTLFAKALRTYVQEEINSEKKIEFIDAKAIYDANPNVTIKDLFALAEYLAPCILFFDEIDLFAAHREKSAWTTSQFLTCMQGIDMVSKQVIVIGATNRPNSLDDALLKDGRFGKRIPLEYPKYNHRKVYLEQQLDKRHVMLDANFIDHIAQETEGCSYNNLKRIITEAFSLSSIQAQPIQENDFEKTLDSEIRQILPATNMLDEDKEIISIYQAGKAVIREIYKTKQQVVKVTIHNIAKDIKSNEFGMVIKSDENNQSENEQLATTQKDPKVKLGEVFTKSNINHHDLLNDKDLEHEAAALLAGNVALELIKNQNYTQCNPQDRAEALRVIYKMITFGEKITPNVQKQALEIKNKLEQEIKATLLKHKDFLIAVANTLQKQAMIDRYEWKALAEAYCA